MTSPIDAEERAWALECLAAGDTLANLAEGSGRRQAEWVVALGKLARIPDWVSDHLALRDLGLTRRELDERYNISRHAIYRAIVRARALGLTVSDWAREPYTPEAVREKIIALADEQLAYSDIAAQLGVDVKTVAKFAGPSRRDPKAAIDRIRRRA